MFSAAPRRRHSRIATIVVATSFAFAVACGGDDDKNGGPTGPGGIGGSMSATVNGAAFNPIAVQGAYSQGVAVITGTGTTGSITINVNNAGAGAGTYQLGPTTANGATFSALNGTATAGSWASNATGGSGTITFTTLTASKAQGTFSFTGGAVAGTGATGTRAVTNGTFNITLTTLGQN